MTGAGDLDAAEPPTADAAGTAQIVFRELVFGTLVYAVVIGFFNDYTDIISTTSYSTTFLVAVVLQLLTLATLELKRRVGARFKGRTGRANKIGHAFSVWLILFLSKFVFLAVLDVLFRDDLHVSGFVGLMVIIMVMTISKELLDFTYRRLAR